MRANQLTEPEMKWLKSLGQKSEIEKVGTIGKSCKKIECLSRNQ